MNEQFFDILAPRKAEFSNFMWASRGINPQVAHAHQQALSPQQLKEAVVNSAKIQQLLLVLSHKQNVPKKVLEVQVMAILDEIGYNKKLKVIRWLGLVLVKICNRICTGIYVNANQIDEMKSLMGDCPVIFVPSHRSYADFILMSLVCFSQDLAIPAIAAGMDFHGMWGMGTVLRDTGAFFMRRSYNDDSLYWTTFKQYVYQIVTKGELPIEFFIEGTRSRSNKSLTPKYGLILMILKAFFLAQVPDILFVPINISYDRILEEKLFAFELLGIPKPKESTSGFFKSLSIIKENYGSTYFNFGKAISAKAFFGSKFNRTGHNLQPIHQQEISDDEKHLVPGLAYEIVHRQQKQSTITAFNIMAVALYVNLTAGESLLTVEELTKAVLWLKKVTESLGAYVHLDNVEGNILEALEVHKNIIQLNEQGKLCLVSDNIVLDTLSQGKLKAHELSEKTLTYSVPFVLLQIYINPVLHYYVDVAVLTVVLKYYKKLRLGEMCEHYKFLRRLLSQEFVTFENREQVEFNNAVEDAINMELIRRSDDWYELSNSNKTLETLMCNCVDSFIFSYFVVCSLLGEVASSILDETSIMAVVQEDIERRLVEKKSFIHPYSLSLDTISNCLNVLSAQKALIKSRNGGGVTYEICKSSVCRLKERLAKHVDPLQATQQKLKNVHLRLNTKL